MDDDDDDDVFFYNANFAWQSYKSVRGRASKRPWSSGHGSLLYLHGVRCNVRGPVVMIVTCQIVESSMYF